MCKFFNGDRIRLECSSATTTHLYVNGKAIEQICVA